MKTKLFLKNEYLFIDDLFLQFKEVEIFFDGRSVFQGEFHTYKPINVKEYNNPIIVYIFIKSDDDYFFYYRGYVFKKDIYINEKIILDYLEDFNKKVGDMIYD